MRNVMPTYGRKSVSFSRGEGAWLWDTEGKRYLDGLCGIAVTGLGHAHPKISEAICKQAIALLLLCCCICLIGPCKYIDNFWFIHHFVVDGFGDQLVGIDSDAISCLQFGNMLG